MILVVTMQYTVIFEDVKNAIFQYNNFDIFLYLLKT